MQVIQDFSAQDFLAAASPMLYEDEALNSLLLGLCESSVSANEPSVAFSTFARIVESGQTVAAAMATSLNLILTRASGAQLELLAQHFRQRGADFPGVVGPAVEAKKFAEVWCHLTKKKFHLGMGQKIYWIKQVIVPDPAGELRQALPAEADLITQWLVEFSNEALPEHERSSIEKTLPRVTRAIEGQRVYVLVVDNQPVTMAFVGRPTKNGISVSGVYTPKNLRKRGFASAVVALLSQKMLNSGKQFCVLYTDLANPISNKIYQRIGYEEVADSSNYLFTS